MQIVKPAIQNLSVNYVKQDIFYKITNVIAADTIAKPALDLIAVLSV